MANMIEKQTHRCPECEGYMRQKVCPQCGYYDRMDKSVKVLPYQISK